MRDSLRRWVIRSPLSSTPFTPTPLGMAEPHRPHRREGPRKASAHKVTVPASPALPLLIASVLCSNPPLLPLPAPLSPFLTWSPRCPPDGRSLRRRWASSPVSSLSSATCAPFLRDASHRLSSSDSHRHRLPTCLLPPSPALPYIPLHGLLSIQSALREHWGSNPWSLPIHLRQCLLFTPEFILPLDGAFASSLLSLDLLTLPLSL